ncbi:hypothetical protein [Sutcliffiella cohnii]|uniref:hypothetical protein n=1 Tax=Sutcliffiella cohnii TaxID=33932 RepID=UPI002E2389C3|nr:hypothetical protein [Sutcliffiella cohnii]
MEHRQHKLHNYIEMTPLVIMLVLLESFDFGWFSFRVITSIRPFRLIFISSFCVDEFPVPPSHMILKQLPLISLQMGHVEAQGTIRDHIKSSDSNVELDFVCDIFNFQTKEIIDKWFGGHDGARGVINELRKLNDK